MESGEQVATAKIQVHANNAIVLPEPIDIQPDRTKLVEEQARDESLKKCFSAIGRQFVSQSGHQSGFLLEKKIIYRRHKFPSGKEFKLLVVATKYKMLVLRLGHEGLLADQGAKKMEDRVVTEFYWPGVHTDVKRFVKSCDTCQRTISNHLVGRAPLRSMPTIDVPFQRVAIDIFGPLKLGSNTGNKYILTMVDFATRYADAVDMPSMDTIQMAEALLQMFSIVGLPREILSDQGRNFTSELMREIS